MAFLLPPVSPFSLGHRPNQTTSPRRRRARACAHPPSRLTDDDRSLDALLSTLRANLPQTSPAASQTSSSNASPSTVYLVGTGPGDPGLLTLRALHLMQRADVVLYDRLVSDDILALVSSSARMVYVGKSAGFHTRSQQDIHLLLALFAERSATVVRLKGGDPTVFGRGGEETDFLERLGLRVVTVPGITAASGIAAALGIPLTMRGVSQSLRYLTGHLRSGGVEDVGPVDESTTYVVYMGLVQLPAIVTAMTRRGLPPSIPSVAIERGTTSDQRVVCSQLSDLPALVERAALKSPTLIIVGHVVALAHVWDVRDQIVDVPYEYDWAPDASNLGDPILKHALQALDGDSADYTQ